MGVHVIGNGAAAVIDEDGTQAFDDRAVLLRAGGKDLCAEGTRNLQRHVPYSAGAAMYQHLVPGLNACAVDQTRHHTRHVTGRPSSP